MTSCRVFSSISATRFGSSLPRTAADRRSATPSGTRLSVSIARQAASSTSSQQSTLCCSENSARMAGRE